MSNLYEIFVHVTRGTSSVLLTELKKNSEKKRASTTRNVFFSSVVLL